FRPEYRQLRELRGRFPGVPLMALTATATGRVRTDIVEQLHLRDPGCYVASFNRPNLNYRVVPKSGGSDQVLDYVTARPRECGIVYCQSRKGAESLARKLVDDGIPAAPYHAGLEPADRARNQERFLRDEVRVICATIAFGMGINKPNVRYVIHYDLPKNVEGYYQETGRAGRDGLPGECVLLFGSGDVVKQQMFINEKPDPEEQRIAREQLQQMVHYAEISACRRAALLDYFGEEYPESNCGGCDNCLSPRETYDGTIDAQKLLSCVFRIKQKSGFSVGLNHVIEVLTGADTDKIRRWAHTEVSTYGIGKDHSRPEWAAIGRELVRLGFLRQTNEKFSTLELTAAGGAVLKERKPVQLSRPMIAPAKPAATRSGDIACDEALFDKLRTLRKRLADERDVPAYIVFSDVALRQMARQYPSNEREFTRISGVGDRKLAEFGQVFLSEIAAHLQVSPRLTFETAPAATVPTRASGPVRMNDSVRETLKRFRSGEPVDEIASHRGFVAGTILGHLATAIEAGEKLDLDQLFTPDQQKRIAEAFGKFGWGNLPGVMESLGGEFNQGHLRLFRAAQNLNRR
ncbi:MAG: RecQ family ATP-dependent DNA helicase, partial [Opitutaceae bacterium]|nr:RecQ family ATP-dependent DNA helicase [Verrucomicrobiales bacterium]